MKRVFFFLSASFLFFAVFFFLAAPKASAEENFTYRYDITYEVNPTGQTSVTYQVNITNLTTQRYVSEYDLYIPNLKIKEVLAVDKAGRIDPEISIEDNFTKIHLVFNYKAVGKGSVLTFVLSYQNSEIAKRNGRIWEITIPPRSESPGIREYNVNLRVPASFGKMAYASAQPTSKFRWTKEQLTGGVVVAFGDYQVFKFNLKYHLNNPKLFPVYTEIALPPDTSYQHLRFDKILPEPRSIRQDEDGNWLARYDLSPGEKIGIQVEGEVKLIPFPDFPETKNDIKTSKYLADQKYWEVADSQIQELAKELETPQAIYDYVVATLKYDYKKAQDGGERLGAKGVLASPEKAICMEFTDLFIALARAAGIPAREIDGFAYTTNSKLRPLSLEKDILHAWPEFWDAEQKKWIMVDPTWGATTGGIDYFKKLDFNHFTLAIKGVSSESPHPAGAYKLDGENGKDVEVEFSPKDWQEGEIKYEVLWDLPKWAINGLKLTGSLEIKNSSATLLRAENLQIDSSPSGFLKKQSFNLTLAPGEKHRLNLSFSQDGWFKSFDGTLLLNVNGKIFSQPFQAKPLSWVIILSSVIILILILAVIVFYLRPRKKALLPEKTDEQIINKPSS